MNMRKTLALFLIVGFGILLGSISFNLKQEDNSGQSLGVKTSPIIGGIVPHHMLAEEYIHDLFIRLTEQQPQTIILMGPNHEELGDFPIITAGNDWDTPHGTLPANITLIDKLISSGIAHRNDAIIANEHSIFPLMPLIAMRLPDTTVVPIILSNHMNLSEIELLSTTLSEYVGPNTVLIAAVDFSHYLKTDEAKMNDEETIEFIKSYNVEKIITLDNAYLDSPSSIGTLLLTMQEQSASRLEIVDHGNSGELLSDPATETTSYLEVVFYQ